MSSLYRGSVAVALASVFFAATARAELITLNVDSALSSLTLSGSAYGLSFAEQAPGSLTAQYAGTITGDLSGGVFTFSGGSAINALATGPYSNAPNTIGPEMGNYGVVASGTLPPPYSGFGPQVISGVYKNIILDLTAGTATNGAATTATFNFNSAHLDYGANPSGLTGDSSMVGDNAANASASNVTWNGTTLTIPVSFTITEIGRASCRERV